MDLTHLFHKGMKRVIVGLVISITALLPSTALAQVTVMGGDGSYLGLVSDDRYGEQSICNRYGDYGSPYKETSIFNQYGDYGSPYSELGAYNTRAVRPPALVENGSVILIISKDKTLNPKYRIDPDILRIQVCGEPL